MQNKYNYNQQVCQIFLSTFQLLLRQAIYFIKLVWEGCTHHKYLIEMFQQALSAQKSRVQKIRGTWEPEKVGSF